MEFSTEGWNSDSLYWNMPSLDSRHLLLRHVVKKTRRLRNTRKNEEEEEKDSGWDGWRSFQQQQFVVECAGSAVNAFITVTVHIYPSLHANLPHILGAKILVEIVPVQQNNNKNKHSRR
jgi:hypothetical protein